MNFKNVELILNKSSFFNNVDESVFRQSDAIFCSENSSFGGFSFAYAFSIHKMLIQSERNDIQTYTLEQIIPLGIEINKLAIIKTPIIKQNRAEAKALMTEILAVCRKEHLRKIVLTHFIKLSSTKYDSNLMGILDCLNDNNFSYEITIILPIDEDNFDSFQSIIDNYNNV